MIMIETIAQPGPLTLARVQAEATAADGWLVIMTTEGRVFTLAGNIVTCHADAAEFTDDNGEHVVLPYAQIATVEIDHD
jgi:hypothetical protein